MEFKHHLKENCEIVKEKIKSHVIIIKIINPTDLVLVDGYPNIVSHRYRKKKEIITIKFKKRTLELRGG